MKISIGTASPLSYSGQAISTGIKEIRCHSYHVNDKGDLLVHAEGEPMPLLRIQAGHWLSVERLDI